MVVGVGMVVEGGCGVVVEKPVSPDLKAQLLFAVEALVAVEAWCRLAL